MYEYRCDERIKDKDVGSTRLTYTRLCGGWRRPLPLLAPSLAFTPRRSA
jgi:hypothetical protein